MSPLAERLELVRDGVRVAARAAGRDPAAVSLIVVTKFQPVSVVSDLMRLGVRDFGESRHQEAREKAAHLPSVRWHFVGQLQTKKAAAVAAYASAVHSVDRTALVRGLSATGQSADLEVFLQVNLTDNPERGGAASADVPRLTELLSVAPGLRLRGVMGIAPLGEEPRRAFARLRHAAEQVRSIAPDAVAISAGMSGDYPAAIAEGATHLRIGTAITGTRSDPR